MNIYLVKRTDNYDYDDFDAMIVAAESEQAARELHPRTSNNKYHIEDSSKENYEMWKSDIKNENGEYLDENGTWYTGMGEWVRFDEIDSLIVEKIGITDLNESQVLLASFNAG